ncbi:MAG TPA: hypothetical protein VMO76_05080 [Candidatus Udaeobacter sp.]|nr:hypothetical protein [Candidatus Udaeobacter sp.]
MIVELAAHLDEVFTELRGQGLTAEEAFRRTFSQVEDWQDLRRRIQTRQDKGARHVESRQAILAAQPIDPFSVDGPSSADPDFWPQSLAGRATQQERLVTGRSRPDSLRSLVAVTSFDRSNGGLSVKSGGRLTTRGVLFHRFSRPALFGLFPDWRSFNCDIQ